MLVLTRKSNQSIMIGDDIEVSVLSIMGEKVRIGIEAPRSSRRAFDWAAARPRAAPRYGSKAVELRTLGTTGVKVRRTPKSL